MIGSSRSPATRRYFVRLALFAALYVGVTFIARWTFDHYDVTGVAAWALALMPAIAALGVLWAVMRVLVEETDEFLRLLLVRQFLVATIFCLTITTMMDWLHNFDLIGPGNYGFSAYLLWFLGLAVGAIYNRVTMGTSGNCR